MSYSFSVLYIFLFIYLYLFLCMDIVHIVVLVAVCTLWGKLSAAVFTLKALLRRVVCFTADNV